MRKRFGISAGADSPPPKFDPPQPARPLAADLADGPIIEAPRLPSWLRLPPEVLRDLERNPLFAARVLEWRRQNRMPDLMPGVMTKRGRWLMAAALLLPSLSLVFAQGMQQAMGYPLWGVALGSACIGLFAPHTLANLGHITKHHYLIEIPVSGALYRHALGGWKACDWTAVALFASLAIGCLVAWTLALALWRTPWFLLTGMVHLFLAYMLLPHICTPRLPNHEMKLCLAFLLKIAKGSNHTLGEHVFSMSDGPRARKMGLQQRLRPYFMGAAFSISPSLTLLFISWVIVASTFNMGVGHRAVLHGVLAGPMVGLLVALTYTQLGTARSCPSYIDGLLDEILPLARWSALNEPFDSALYERAIRYPSRYRYAVLNGEVPWPPPEDAQGSVDS